jgi:hypothetical protein
MIFHSFCLSYVWKLILVHIWDALGFSSENRCDSPSVCRREGPSSEKFTPPSHGLTMLSATTAATAGKRLLLSPPSPLTSRHLVAAGPLRTPGSLGLQSGPRRRLRPLLRCPPPRRRPRPLHRPREVKFSFFFKEEKEASSHMEGSTDKLPPS